MARCDSADPRAESNGQIHPKVPDAMLINE